MSNSKSLSEYQSLVAQQKLRALTPEERQKLEFLEDVLLEFGALPTEEDQHPVRTPRVAAKLEVTFTSKEAITQSYAHDIGTGGIAITTDRNLNVGDALELKVRLPGDPQPLDVRGTIAWKRNNMVGVSFSDLAPPDERRLKAHLLTNDSLLKRVRASLERKRGPMPVAAKTIVETPAVQAQGGVLIALLEPSLEAIVIEMLNEMGFRAFEGRTTRGRTPTLAAVEPGVPDSVLAGCPASLPIICVNVSGPDALFGWLLSRNVQAFVRRRATAAAVVSAVEEALKTLG